MIIVSFGNNQKPTQQFRDQFLTSRIRLSILIGIQFGGPLSLMNRFFFSFFFLPLFRRNINGGH